jgi:hypothetical protein
MRRRTLLTATAAAGPAALLMGLDDALADPPARPAPGRWTADRPAISPDDRNGPPANPTDRHERSRLERVSLGCCQVG